jgi:hypothetical protein
MLKQVATVLIGSCALTCAAQQSQTNPQIIRLEAKGNLEATAPLGCVDLQSVTAAHTPADIVPGIRLCLDSAKYEKAAVLFAVAGVFGKFDTLRVADKTAHQAVAALQVTHLNSVEPEHKSALQKVLKEIAEPKSAALAQICGYLKAMGPPSYQPTYMLQHGMSAFTGKGGGTTAGFNSAEAWATSLDSYLHCPL